MTRFRSFVLSTVAITLAAVSLAAQADSQRKPQPARATVPQPEPPLFALPRLELTATEASFDARIEASTEFIALVLLADSSQLQYFLVDLPPMLVDAVVMGVGKSKGGAVEFSLPRPKGIDFSVYGQAVIFDHRGLTSTDPIEAESVGTKR